MHETGTAIGGNVANEIAAGHEAGQCMLSANNNDVSYDVNNNNHTDGNNNTENIGDNKNNNTNDNKSENINDINNQNRQADADRNLTITQQAPNDEGPSKASHCGEDSPSGAATTELNISTARLFLDQRQLDVDGAQQQVGTPSSASASLIINDYLSANNNERRGTTSVPIATVLHTPAAQFFAAPIQTPTILETTSQQDDGPKEDPVRTNGFYSSNCLNVNTGSNHDDDSDENANETTRSTAGNQRRSRQGQRNMTNNNNDNNVGDFDSPMTPAEVEGAAIKIQSAFRGYRTRKNSPYRSSSARCSPNTPSEDSEQQHSMQTNGYHLNRTIGDHSPSPSPSPAPSTAPAELSSSDQQQPLPELVSSKPVRNDDDDDIKSSDNNLNQISQPLTSNLACRRLARQRPTENHSSGSAEDQNQCPVLTSPLIQSMSIDDENTCTVIEGKSQITNDESIEGDGKIEYDNSSQPDKANIGTKQNEEVKSYSIDVIQQHNREFDSEKPRAKSLEQYNQHWPSQEQDTDSSALGAASSYNEDTEEEGGLITTTATNLTNDDQQLSSTLENGQDVNCSEAEANLSSRYDNQPATNEENGGELTVEMFPGNILPRPSINSTTADLSFANEDDESMMRQVQEMVDEMEADNERQDEGGNDKYDGAQLDDDSIHSNEDGNAENNQIVCEPEPQSSSGSSSSSSSSDLGEEIQLDEPIVEASQAEEELEGARQITHKNSTDEARLAVITEEDMDEHQQQAILEVQHAMEMESDDIEKRDPSGNMSDERRISSPKISMVSSPSFEKRLSNEVAYIEQDQSIDVPSLNVELVSNNPEKTDPEIQRVSEEGNNQKNLTEQLGKDKDEASANSGGSSPVEGSTTYGNSGTDEEDDENGDIVNNEETSGQSRNAPKNNSGAATNQEKKASNKQNQNQNQQQQQSNKNRNKKNKRKNKK